MNKPPRLLNISMILPFILVTSLFFAWGFANDITNPMVKAFSKIFRMSVAEGSLVQLAFYGGYFAMAFPAAMFISKYSYKSGIVMGLVLYALGALLFIPAAMLGDYYPFLAAYFILTCGLSFLETSANPYIMSMGDPHTATRRLNLAQSFNPIGSLLGMYCAMNMVQEKLNPLSSADRFNLAADEFEVIKNSDLEILTKPYMWVGLAIIALLALILLTKMPITGDSEQKSGNILTALRRIIKIPGYREGVIAQFFYVGVQIMCWTFIIQYGTNLFTSMGMEEHLAEIKSQQFNMVAMVIFCLSRFICTFLLKFISPGKLLMILAIVGAILVCGVIGFRNIMGLYSLVAVSACMSLMFPTIYGIALTGIGADTKTGAAGLIMAILGGSVMPPMQAAIIDCGTIAGIPAINISFIIPLICFAVIAVYGFRSVKRE